MHRFLRVWLCWIMVIRCGTAAALPPLGLTATNLSTGGALEIIDGTAYISSPTRIRTVSSSGDLDYIALSHPSLSSPWSITRVVKDNDGRLYAGATFGTFGVAAGIALFDLEHPLAPVLTWDGDYRAAGVERDLAVLGNKVLGDSEFEATRFSVDGTTQPMAHPPGPNFNNGTSLLSSTPSGHAIGHAGIPGTAGIGLVKWEPNGDISFISTIGVADSVRDRADGAGANIGWYDFEVPVVTYGDGRSFGVFQEDGGSFYDGLPFNIRAIVSQGDFTLVEVFAAPFQGVSGLYGFFPGIVPGFPNRALPLLDIFPELAAIDIDRINDLASVDGYLYMTLSGADGTFLFGARDPSVVPEPGGLVLMLLGGLLVLRRSVV